MFKKCKMCRSGNELSSEEIWLIHIRQISCAVQDHDVPRGSGVRQSKAHDQYPIGIFIADASASCTLRHYDESGLRGVVPGRRGGNAER